MMTMLDMALMTTRKNRLAARQSYCSFTTRSSALFLRDTLRSTDSLHSSPWIVTLFTGSSTAVKNQI
jgi:hypothetical protein